MQAHSNCDVPLGFPSSVAYPLEISIDQLGTPQDLHSTYSVTACTWESSLVSVRIIIARLDLSAATGHYVTPRATFSTLLAIK